MPQVAASGPPGIIEIFFKLFLFAPGTLLPTGQIVTRMSLPDAILVFFTDRRASHRRLKQLVKYGSLDHLYDKFQNVPRAHVRIAVGRLHAQGLLRKKSSVWNVTAAGLERIGRKLLFHSDYPEPPKTDRRVIVSFDIPERNSKKRRWLRSELKLLGFSILQESLWIGPAPLPEEFIRRVEEVDILRYMKFFEAKELDIVSG